MSRPAYGWIILLIISFNFAGLPNLVAQEPKLPELDIILSSKFPPELKDVQSNYYMVFQRHMATIFYSLNPRIMQAGDATIKDGTAKYRLFIEHVGKVDLGTQITSDAAKVTTVQDGFNKFSWIHTYYLDAKQSGTLNLKLCKWNPDEMKYEDVLKWTVPMPVSDREESAKGRIKIGETGGFMGTTDNNKCPVEFTEALRIATLSVMPGSIRDVLFSKWIQVTPLKVTSKPVDPKQGGGFDVTGELSVKNNSPWTLKKLQILVAFGNGVFFPGTGPVEMHGAAPWVEFPKPLAPGEEAKVPVLGKDRKSVKPGFQGIEFLPAASNP